jgi:uncharacterized protein YcbX
MRTVGTVESLWRYPVKSMLGEQIDHVTVDARGMVGDRLYAVQDPTGRLGSGKQTYRFRRIDGLAHCSARYEGDMTPVITLPSGKTVRADDEDASWALARELDAPDVMLAREDLMPHFDAASLHVLTTASLAWLVDAVPSVSIDVRRLRPNIVIRVDDEIGLPEDRWIGHVLTIGEQLAVGIAQRTPRCRMVGMSQRDPANTDLPELEHSSEVLRTVTARNEMCLGVHAQVLRVGRVRVGDPVEIDID